MKTVALGTKLYVEDDSDEYIPVGHITSIPVPGPNKPEIDASFRPVAGGPREAYTFTGSIRVSGAVERGNIS